MFSAIRTRFRLNSVRARLTFWYLCTLAASLGAFAVFVFVVRAGTLYRELDADVEVRAHQLADHLRPALLALDVPAELAGESRVADAPVIVRQGAGLVMYRSRGFPTLDWRGESRLAAAARDRVPVSTVHDRSGTPIRIATVSVNRPGAEPLAIQVAGSTAPVRHILRQLATAMMMAILVVLAVASYGSSFTARRAFAPVDEIVARVRHIQANRLSGRLDIRAGSDELDRLVATLNEMLDRIETSVGSARRFAADASHELQTPLAAMRGAVELCLHGQCQPGDYQVMAADLIAEIERLSALVRSLRLLALADAGHLVTHPEPVDLAALVAECCDIARAIAEDKQIQVETAIHDRPVVAGSPVHLRQVVLNLAENAIRYSPVRSTVRVSVARANAHAVLMVEDQGCGIAAPDLPHVFEPFYRADPARARNTGGTGLGLAIADQVVRAHGGHIQVASTPAEGSTFSVYLPMMSRE